MHTRKGWRALMAWDRYARGYGRAWLQLRKEILARDDHECQALELMRPASATARVGVVRCALRATHVDHILAKSRGGLDIPENLISLCARHHRSKTGREGKAAQA
jgi:5-methylcytosine-specific restriction endonuclease McrA